jgi:tetratricopeptide (TPR) repeat protein
MTRLHADTGSFTWWRARCTDAILVLSLIFLAACAGSPGFTAYRTNLMNGANSLLAGNNASALPQFLAANQADPTQEMPLALAGQTAYRLGDLDRASQYLARAWTIIGDSQSPASVIVKGYQALIAFKQERRQEGLERLKEYVQFYKNSYPDLTYETVQQMSQSGDINLPQLEQLINEEMNRYVKGLLALW